MGRKWRPAAKAPRPTTLSLRGTRAPGTRDTQTHAGLRTQNRNRFFFKARNKIRVGLNSGKKMQKKTHCPQKAASMAGAEASAALRPAPAARVRVGGPAAPHSRGPLGPHSGDDVQMAEEDGGRALRDCASAFIVPGAAVGTFLRDPSHRRQPHEAPTDADARQSVWPRPCDSCREQSQGRKTGPGSGARGGAGAARSA